VTLRSKKDFFLPNCALPVEWVVGGLRIDITSAVYDVLTRCGRWGWSTRSLGNGKFMSPVLQASNAFTKVLVPSLLWDASSMIALLSTLQYSHLFDCVRSRCCVDPPRLIEERSGQDMRERFLHVRSAYVTDFHLLASTVSETSFMFMCIYCYCLRKTVRNSRSYKLKTYKP
jgi:hypothetical protein